MPRNMTKEQIRKLQVGTVVRNVHRYEYLYVLSCFPHYRRDTRSKETVEVRLTTKPDAETHEKKNP
jgi:hypothetical protein